MKTTNNDWPKDVSIEILSKLPVKSLLRFKCISKSLRALLETSDLILMHLTNYNDDHALLVASYLDGEQNRITVIFPDETLADISHQNIHPKSEQVGIVMGTQDGLFVLSSLDQLHLWNPATKESIDLSLCRDNVPDGMVASCPQFGYGIDPISKGYKLVMVSFLSDYQFHHNYTFSHVAIYTLNTNTWKLFGDGFVNYVGLGLSVYLNGVCYWTAKRKNKYGVILSFNMSEETFQEIENPCADLCECSTLGLYSNHVALIISDVTKSYVDIWVMDKEKCFTKNSNIGPIDGSFYGPLGFWKNDVIFFKNFHEPMFLYDTNSKRLKDLKVADDVIEVDSFVYKESLINCLGSKSNMNLY